MRRYDRSRVMRLAHREWRAVKDRPGASFSRCLRAAWRAEKERVDGRQPYNPEPHWTPPDALFAFIEAGRQIRELLAA